jgi:hypothetical protein
MGCQRNLSNLWNGVQLAPMASSVRPLGGAMRTCASCFSFDIAFRISPVRGWHLKRFEN